MHAVVFRGDRVLLIRHAHPPSQDRRSVPGGVNELGEPVREAARRELREDCGVEIEVDRVIDVADVVTNACGTIARQNEP